MVTPAFVKGAAITLFAFVGMVVGFRVQDGLRAAAEQRVAERVEREFEEALAKRRARPTASAVAAPGAPPQLA